MLDRYKLTAARGVILMTMLAGAPPALAQGAKAPATKSDFITTPDGVQIHYLEAGELRVVGSVQLGGTPPPGATTRGQVSLYNMRQEPAILFVPGWTMPAEIWEKQVSYFSKTHHVVAMDPRSQGESTKFTEGHYPAARARDIKAVVDQLRLAPVLLVGWSMAVTEIAAYVDQFGTDTIAGMVLVDGTAGRDMSPDTVKGIFTFVNNLQSDRRTTTERFVRWMYKKPQSEEYLRRITEASLRTPTNTAVALLTSGLSTDNRPALAKINKPALIIGTKSPFEPLYQEMNKRIAGSRLEILDGVGHALFVDDPDHFNSLLDGFLKDVGAPLKEQ